MHLAQENELENSLEIEKNTAAVSTQYYKYLTVWYHENPDSGTIKCLANFKFIVEIGQVKLFSLEIEFVF